MTDLMRMAVISGCSVGAGTVAGLVAAGPAGAATGAKLGLATGIKIALALKVGEAAVNLGKEGGKAIVKKTEDAGRKVEAFVEDTNRGVTRLTSSTQKVADSFATLGETLNFAGKNFNSLIDKANGGLEEAIRLSVQIANTWSTLFIAGHALSMCLSAASESLKTYNEQPCNHFYESLNCVILAGTSLSLHASSVSIAYEMARKVKNMLRNH